MGRQLGDEVFRQRLEAVDVLFAPLLVRGLESAELVERMQGLALDVLR